MPELPTVKIKHPDGFAIINEADFIEGQHELFDAPARELAAAPTEAQIRKMNKADLRELLARHEIEAPADASGAQLVELALPFAAQQD